LADLRALVVSSSPFLAGAWTQGLSARGHAAVAYLTTAGPPRRRSDGYREVVERHGGTSDVIVSSRPSVWAAMFAPYDLDLLVCIGFPWRLPADLLRVPRLGAINAHPSLLPKYRGAGPNVFGWIFRNDERETGMTVHRMSPDFDTGPILVQEAVSIDDDDNAGSLAAKLGPVLMRVIDQGLAAAEAGEPGVPQGSDGFYCEAFEEEWRYVDWNRPARLVHNQVRSWTGMESQGHAVARLDGAEVTVKRTRLIADADAGGGVPAGTVLRRDSAGVLVQCADGPLLVIDWEPRP
jgi:methionyl-tRNA formyltransferase